MFVIVPFKLDVDATARLSHMENQIVGAQKSSELSEALEQAIRAT